MTDVAKLTPRMRGFLEWAAQCEPGKGLPPDPHDKHIASKAVNDGYGMMLGFGKFMLFIINDKGRAEAARPPP